MGVFTLSARKQINQVPFYYKKLGQVAPDTNFVEHVGDTKVSVSEIEGKTRFAGSGYDPHEEYWHTGQEDAFFYRVTSPLKSAAIPAKLIQTFHFLDSQNPVQGMGAAAVIAWVSAKEDKAYIAHAGDSMAILMAIKEETGDVFLKKLTEDHSVDNPKEVERVRALDGYVGTAPYEPDTVRLRKYGPEHPLFATDQNGVKVVRSIGDKEYLGMTAEPELTELDFSRYQGPKVRLFMLVTCDGILDKKITLNDYKEIAAKCYQEGKLDELSARMTAEAVKRGSDDNVTVMAAEIKRKRTSDLVMSVFDGHGGSSVSRKAAQLMDGLIPKLSRLPRFLVSVWERISSFGRNILVVQTVAHVPEPVPVVPAPAPTTAPAAPVFPAANTPVLDFSALGALDAAVDAALAHAGQLNAQKAIDAARAHLIKLITDLEHTELPKVSAAKDSLMSGPLSDHFERSVQEVFGDIRTLFEKNAERVLGVSLAQIASGSAKLQPVQLGFAQKLNEDIVSISNALVPAVNSLLDIAPGKMEAVINSRCTEIENGYRNSMGKYDQNGQFVPGKRTQDVFEQLKTMSADMNTFMTRAELQLMSRAADARDAGIKQIKTDATQVVDATIVDIRKQLEPIRTKITTQLGL